MSIYVFFRKDKETGEQFFYPVEIESEDHVPDHAHVNPGTLKVEDAGGRVVWSPEMDN